MRRRAAVLVAAAWITLGCGGSETAEPAATSVPDEAGLEIRSVAIRVHDMEAMTAFYSEAFGAEFRPVETAGISSQFATLGDLTLKLVPIREAADFEGYPVLQLGLSVPDIEEVIAIAQRHGGRREGATQDDGRRLHASVRDPDGNTIELYQSR